MKTQTRIWPRVCAALIVAVGIAVAWGLLAMWLGYFAYFSSRFNGIYESIYVLLDGTPIIESRSFSNYANVSYRTLDGKPIEQPDDNQYIPQSTFAPSRKPPGLFEEVVSWQSRIVGLNDYQRRPAMWYFVRSDEPIGSAYFAGFDQESSMPVGYIGRGGFSPVVPLRDQWFDVGRLTFQSLYSGYTGEIMTVAGGVNPNARTTSYGYVSARRQEIPPSWMVYLVDGDRLWAIDLQARTAKTIYESAELLGVNILNDFPDEVATKAAPQPPDKTATHEPPTNGKPQTASPDQVKWVRRLAVRKTDRLVILDFKGDSKREYLIPQPMRDGNFNIASLENGELLARWPKGDYRTSLQYDLAWIRPDGTITRKAQAQLVNSGREDEHQIMWLALPVAPIPIAWTAVSTMIAPIAMVQSNEAATFQDAWAEIFRMAGIPFLIVLAVGILLAWLTLRLQRKYHRSLSGVWTAFVFLLGVPGFIAYLIEHRRAKLEPCGDCGKVVPRDRESCAACNKEFAPPPQIGTEIFA